MEHSIALVTGATSGLGYAAARALAGEGWREIIVTGRSLARVQETAAQLAAETNTQVFTPLELDLNAPASVQSALAELVKRGRPVDLFLVFCDECYCEIYSDRPPPGMLEAAGPQFANVVVFHSLSKRLEPARSSGFGFLRAPQVTGASWRCVRAGPMDMAAGWA